MAELALVPHAELRRKSLAALLADSQLLILSTGPFTREDVAAIRDLGPPAWLAEAMLRHDTYAQVDLTAFPGVPYLAPQDFAAAVNYPTVPLAPPPPTWSGQVMLFEGVSSLRETGCCTFASRTLIVAALALNFPGDQACGGKTSRPGNLAGVPADRESEVSLRRSIARIMAWDFDRLIMGHGVPLRSGANVRLGAALRDAHPI